MFCHLLTFLLDFPGLSAGGLPGCRLLDSQLTIDYLLTERGDRPALQQEQLGIVDRDRRLESGLCVVY